jgi:hypothetical protein
LDSLSCPRQKPEVTSKTTGKKPDRYLYIISFFDYKPTISGMNKKRVSQYLKDTEKPL